ncbi:ABC transporter-like [Trinorchestia longiramus]|nr:ABC transporter-like [Trinorchestia longiramus]
MGGRHTRWGGRLRGDFLLNGNLISPTKLSQRVAYVQQNVHFCPDTSVRQTLLLHAFLRESGDPARGRNVKARINALIEDLGLEQVRHTRVLDLTLSEKRRLNVACHLLLETDVVLLDQPTRGMDIFDTFFLVEYLRQWAGRGRVVILTIQPPTYEIFTMISRVLLVSTGRVMYFGRRREMLPYFAFIEYPCPAYKNPSDYYIDLVTLDDLSSEAMLESSQRVEMLADTFRRKQEALSDPGSPNLLPPKTRKANACITLLALWIRAMIYQFPYNLLRWLGRSLVAALMSVFVGLVFWDVRSAPLQQQEAVNNRLSFYYVLSVVSVWPVVLATVAEVWRDKPSVIRDVRDGLYSRTVFVITKMGVGGGTPGGGWRGTPGRNAAEGVESTKRMHGAFYSYVSHVLVYLFALNTLAIAVATVVPSRHVAAALVAFVMTIAALGAGYTIHPLELSSWSWPTLWWSPARWFLRELTHSDLELAKDFACDRNPVMKDLQSIIQRKVSCGVVTGAQALNYLGLDEAYLPGQYYPALLMFVFYVACLLVFMLGFIFLARTPKKKKYHVE